MARSSLDRSRGGAKRWVLVGAGTVAAVGCIFAALAATTPLADSSLGPASSQHMTVRTQ